jgi:uncharacterized protein (TIGR00106 family)
MAIVATFSVTPVHNGDLTEEIAAAISALDDYDVSCETNPMGTVIEAEELSELFAGVQAAHEAIDADRVRTALRIDDDCDREQNAAERVAAVEDALGRTSTREPPA